jgi:imidazolonepropionase-like amidohydrolase
MNRRELVCTAASAAGRIAAVEPTLTAEAAATLDASGKLVVPGLIDAHTHAARTIEGSDMLLRDGVTGGVRVPRG